MRDTRGVAEPVEAHQDAWRCQACKHMWPLPALKLNLRF